VELTRVSLGGIDRSRYDVTGKVTECIELPSFDSFDDVRRALVG
jgi:hypothetical protein